MGIERAFNKGIMKDNKCNLRKSSIELLRIIAMIMIVAHHFAVHGGFEFSISEVTINRLWIQFIAMGGKIGVNIFVLISGYFLIDNNSIKLSKIIKLYLQMLTWSFLFFIVFQTIGIGLFSVKSFIKRLLPITFTQWGFASTYFVLYLLSPYINKFIYTLNKKEYEKFLLLLGGLWCIIPTLTGQLFESNALVWFVFLYAFAGYIKRFGIIDNINGIRCLWFAMIAILLNFCAVIVFDCLGTKMTFFGTHATCFYAMEKLPTLVISVLLVVAFLKIDIGYKKPINLISSATFGVYLIHDDCYVRPFLWKQVFRNTEYADSNLLIPYSIIVVTIVFVICTLVELLRIYLFERKYMSLLRSRIDKL